MAVQKTTSINEVIGKILRDTRIQDSSYIDDIVEWVSEAMYKMGSYHALVPKRTKLCVEFHHAKLPSDLHVVEAVVYGGKRLFEGGPGIMDAPRKSSSPTTLGTVVGSYSPNGSLDNGSDIETVKMFPDPQSFLVEYDSAEMSTEHWYRKTAHNSLEFSIEDGDVYLYYLAYEVDCDGYLVIPDVVEFKEAIYYYVRMKLVESGWEDPVFKYQDLMMLWEQVHGPRGANAIAQTTPDEEARITRNLIRLIVPDNWASGYAINGPGNIL